MERKVQYILNELHEVISDFLAPYDVTCYLGTDFSYYWVSETIEYTVLVSERQDALFQNFVDTRYPDIHAPIFLWSLLHELGHHETDDYFTEEAHIIFDEYKATLRPELDKDVIEYYNIPDEATATNWAYLFLRDNTEKVSEFWNKIKPLLEQLHTCID